MKTMICVSVEKVGRKYIATGAYIDGPEFDENDEPNEIFSLFDKESFATKKAAIENMTNTAKTQGMDIDKELEIY